MIRAPERPQRRATAVGGLDVAVVIVSWNVRDLLENCLRSVYTELRRARLQGAVWVVDNASTDGTPDFVDTLFPTVNLIANRHNPGFGAANNQGMEAAGGSNPRYYFLLNPDTVLRPNSIKNMVAWMDRAPDVGMAGARLIYGSGRFQHSAFAFPGINQLLFEFLPLPARLYETRLNGRYPRAMYEANHAPFRVDHPLGAAMMVRREVVDATGGFDEAFHMYCEEIDWAWRIRQAGWEIFTVPSAEIIHYGGESTAQIRAQSVVHLWESRARFYKRTYGPPKQAVASHIARLGLRYKAWRADSAEIKQAYQQAAMYW